MAPGLPIPCFLRREEQPTPLPREPKRLPPGHLHWHRIKVDGRPAVYGAAGEGPPVIFLHGWGLGHHAYKRPLARLALRGCRVLAPAMPGFGGTGPLPVNDDIHAFGAWVNAFMDAVGVDEPAIVMGHSFGGGVSIALAHDYPSRVKQLILVNAVGGAVWGAGDKELADRMLWQWGFEFAKELWPPQKGLRAFWSVREDMFENMRRNPSAMLAAGMLAANADLRTELAELRARELPVVVMTGQSDGVIPLSAMDAMCAALGIEGQVLRGNHSWLLTDPDAFDEVMANVVQLQAKLGED
ncbi:MAG: alpha/beta hydrolase [Acidimicrobiales bacterium]|nr:alpha/beta hydrolase [Acidimicrobiales bacterium]